MSKIIKNFKTWSRFKSDTKGNFAIVWALGLTATMVSIGAGIDMTTSSRVSTTAQAAADQVALAASVFYSQHERFPENSDEGFVDGQLYRGTDTGYVFPSSVDTRRVRLKASYDKEKGEVHVKVSGRIRTAFMGMFSRKYKTLPFSAESYANFKDVAIKNPASITLVLDNSGSMQWDDKPAECEWEWKRSQWRWEQECESPNGAESRIDGLKDSVEDFMDLLDGYTKLEAVTSKRVLRTGMIPYSSEIIGNRAVDMKWGTLSNGEINRMQEESGEDNPLRYMIFMTDGQNSGAKQWFEKEDTNYWRGIDCSGGGRWCYYTYETSASKPNKKDHYGWEEGEFISASDRYSKNSCAAMKAQGVRVFTIGFALEPGTYMTNYPPAWGQDKASIPADTTEAAYAMLADCASSPEDFVAAEDVENLDAAFSVIGETIIEDVIRLSQ